MKLSEIEGGEAPPSARGAKLSESGQPGMMESLWAGLVHGAGNMAMGARQLGARVPGMSAVTGETPQGADAAAMQRQKDYQGPFAPGPGEALSPSRANPRTAAAGEFLGEAGVTAPLALASGGAGLGARVGMGALQGAIGGALNPAVSGRDFWTEKATQAGVGAAAGGVMGGAGGVLAPRMGADAQALAARGVGLTPGQRLGAQGAERKLQAFPILSGYVEGRVGKGVEDFNRAAVRQALEPVGVVMPRSVAAGHDMIKFMDSKISDAYDRFLPMLGPIDKGTVDAAIQGNPALQQLKREMSPDDVTRLQAMIDNRVLGRFDPSTGLMDGPLFKKVDHDIGARAASFSGTNSKEIGEGLLLANKALRDEVAKANPQLAPYLTNIDNAWAMSIRLKNAASRRADSEAKFTPSDLMLAIKDGDPSRHHSAFAKGDALMQEFAEQANRVMGKSVGKYPDPSVTSLITGAPFGAAARLPYQGVDIAQRFPSIGGSIGRSAGPFGAGAGDMVSRPPPRDDEDSKRPPRHSVGGP